ncbi:MAG: DUF1573 domain-containing protein [Verrucomicrobiota bacterium]
MIYYSNRLGVLCALVFLMVLSGLVSAKEDPSLESAFASTTAKIATTSNAVNVPVEWTFTNHTDQPMAVEKFDESCGCLSGQAQLEGTVPVNPGESGVIRASFTPGGYRGIVRKSLHVRFVGYQKSIELIVEASIPSSVEVSNKEPVWTVGEEIKTQNIDVTTGTGEDFHIKSLQGVPETLYKISQETVTPKRHYRIQITPISASAPDLQTLQIHTDSKDTRDQVQAVFLRVEK